MALDFYCKNVNNYETLMFHEDGSIKAESEVIIFSLMHIGMNGITEKNWEKVYTRIRIMEEATKPLLLVSKEEDPSGRRFVSPELVKAHIGLTTNVSEETDTWFKNRVFNLLKQSAEFHLNAFKKEDSKTAYL